MSISPANAASTPINEKKNLTNTAINTENDVNIITEAQKHTKEDAQINSVNLNTELTISNFKQSIEDELGCPLNKIEDDKVKSLIKNKFEIIVNKMSCDDLENNLNTIRSEFSDCPEFIDLFLTVFAKKDEKRARKCVDEIPYNVFKECNKETVKILIKYRSIPGTEKLRAENEEFAKNIYKEYPQLIEKLFNSEISEQERIEQINVLEDNEKKAALEYCRCLGINVMIAVDATENKTKYESDPQAAENIINKTNDSAKGMAGYNIFLKKMADFISKNPDKLIIDKNKLTELLDKSSDNKFSKILENVQGKSATDETGKFKTVSEEVIVKSEEKIQAIKQSIAEASTPEPIIVETENSKAETDNTSDTGIVSYETITGDDGVNIIKNIFTGKIKVSEYLEQVAIKKYKLMNTALQGNILLNATGEFFNDLVQNLETSTFEHLLSIGWKGRSYYATQKVKDELEERKNDVA